MKLSKNKEEEEKMIKKIVCAALMIAIIATQAVGAFATVTSSVTSYEGSKINVTTTVSGVENGDTITYVAYKGNIADKNIAYIDQIVVSGVADERYTFTYTADDDFVGANVIQAGLKSDNETPIAKATGTIASKCTISITDGVEGSNFSVDRPASAEGYVKIGYVAPTGKVITAVKVASADIIYVVAADGLWIPAANLMGATLALDITLADSVAASAAVTEKIGYANGEKRVIGSFTGNAADYGVIISTDDFASEAVAYNASGAAEAGTVKFAAGGCNSENQFMICVTGEDEAFKAKAYAGAVEGSALSYAK